MYSIYITAQHTGPDQTRIQHQLTAYGSGIRSQLQHSASRPGYRPAILQHTLTASAYVYSISTMHSR